MCISCVCVCVGAHVPMCMDVYACMYASWERECQSMMNTQVNTLTCLCTCCNVCFKCPGFIANVKLLCS